MTHLIKPKLIDEVRQNTVVIQSKRMDEVSLNSGIIISPKHVLTATHCLIGQTKIIKNNHSYKIIDVVPIIPSTGVALVSLEKPIFQQPIIKIGNNVKLGETLFWVTLAFGKIQEAVFVGHLSASINSYDGITYYYINGAICHGMSGSGVYNTEGELVGMLILMESSPERELTMAIAMPVANFMPLIVHAREDLIIKPKEKTQE